MNILGDELGYTGRWYIVLPPLLLIGFLAGMFFLAAAGQSRLEAANRRVHDSQAREQALSGFIALITDAESGQRGYLLSGEDSYLKPYTEAAAKIPPALDRVHAAYGIGAEDGREIRKLRTLTAQKLAELENTLAFFRATDAEPARGVVRTDVGRRTMEEINQIIGAMRLKESAQLSVATERWQADLLLSRWITAVGAIVNIGLVLLATRLVYIDMRRRAHQARRLRDQAQELELLVGERTRELTALSTHLQVVSEQEKSALSRELHDELGGLLVAARMDLSWLQQRLPTSDPAIEKRFIRIHESLSAGVDLKRRVVEELRPTLLDNMGLFAALRWQFKETCRRAGLVCTETIPELEMKFHPDASIGVFRIAQEALTNILKHAGAKSAYLGIEIDHATFTLRVSDDGKGMPAQRPHTLTSHGIASMRHRVSALGGTWQAATPSTGGSMITVLIPLRRMLLKEPACA